MYIWRQYLFRFMVVSSTHGLSTERFDLVGRTTVMHCLLVLWWWLNRSATCFLIKEALEMVDKPIRNECPQGGVAKSKCWFYLWKKSVKRGFKPESTGTPSTHTNH